MELGIAARVGGIEPHPASLTIALAENLPNPVDCEKFAADFVPDMGLGSRVPNFQLTLDSNDLDKPAELNSNGSARIKINKLLETAGWHFFGDGRFEADIGRLCTLGNKNPLVGKEQARKYARSQNCRFVILSNGNLHYFWDLERGNAEQAIPATGCSNHYCSEPRRHADFPSCFPDSVVARFQSREQMLIFLSSPCEPKSNILMILRRRPPRRTLTSRF